MAIFPAQFFVRDNVRVRSREDYTSRPLVEKSLGHPKGVYLGFIPTAGATDVTLAVDPVRSVSVVKLHSDSDPGGMDIVYTDPVVLDFSGALPSEFPAYIVATATYDRAGLTSAQISARVVPITTGELLYTVGGSAEVVDLASKVKSGAHIALKNSINEMMGSEEKYDLPCSSQSGGSC